LPPFYVGRRSNDSAKPAAAAFCSRHPAFRRNPLGRNRDQWHPISGLTLPH